MNQDNRPNKKTKYSAISLGVVLVAAFVIAQPGMQNAFAVDEEAFPTWDNCDQLEVITPLGDRITQNTIKRGSIVKTIHAEKEVFQCFLDQGNLPVIVDVTTYLEVYENITAREVVKTSALVITCLKDGPFSGSTATAIGCAFYTPGTSPTPTGANCTPGGELLKIDDPQEMNSVRQGNIVKTIETQKEVFFCNLNGTFKKVDLVIFQEVYENMSTMEVVDVQTYEFRCVILQNDGSDDRMDGVVESCTFRQLPTDELIL